jgi:5-methylcytosine-specific restriction endonuclease McrA
VSNKYGVPSMLNGKSNPEYRRRQYSACREEILEKTTAYYYAHRDKAIARRKAAYHKDRDATVKRRREYTREHRDEIRESQRLWRLEHGDEVRARNRAAYHNGQKRSHRANKYRVMLVSMLYQRDGDLCELCGQRVSTEDASVDHIIQVSDGGPHEATNIRLTHLLCNIRRSRTVIDSPFAESTPRPSGGCSTER